MRARVKPTKTWISKSKDEIRNEEELLACRKIILKIIRYMKDNRLSQKNLAEKLNVSPQYINKLLHGQNLDLRITTALRYGRILGLKLIVLPEDEPNTSQSSISYYQIITPINNIGNSRFSYTSNFCKEFQKTVNYGYNSICSQRGFNRAIRNTL